MVRALYERGIAPDLLLGTSPGALNAAFLASGPPPWPPPKNWPPSGAGCAAATSSRCARARYQRPSRAARPPHHRPGAAPARRAAPATSAAGAGTRPAAPGRLRHADRERGAFMRRPAPVEEAAELRQVYAEWPGQILSWLARQGTVPEANPRGPPAPAGAVARGARPALLRGSRVGPVHRADRRRGRGLSRTGRGNTSCHMVPAAVPEA